mgnify:FL=1
MGIAALPARPVVTGGRTLAPMVKRLVLSTAMIVAMSACQGGVAISGSAGVVSTTVAPSALRAPAPQPARALREAVNNRIAGGDLCDALAAADEARDIHSLLELLHEVFRSGDALVPTELRDEWPAARDGIAEMMEIERSGGDPAVVFKERSFAEAEREIEEWTERNCA